MRRVLGAGDYIKFLFKQNNYKLKLSVVVNRKHKMSKVELKKEHEQKFRDLGFIESHDPQFPWERDIISPEVAAELDLYESEIPKLLWGSTGINKGFCIFVPEYFIWISAGTPEQAIEFANQIVAFEPQ